MKRWEATEIWRYSLYQGVKMQCTVIYRHVMMMKTLTLTEVKLFIVSKINNTHFFKYLCV